MKDGMSRDTIISGTNGFELFLFGLIALCGLIWFSALGLSMLKNWMNGDEPKVEKSSSDIMNKQLSKIDDELEVNLSKEEMIIYIVNFAKLNYDLGHNKYENLYDSFQKEEIFRISLKNGEYENDLRFQSFEKIKSKYLIFKSYERFIQKK